MDECEICGWEDCEGDCDDFFDCDEDDSWYFGNASGMVSDD